MDNSVPEEPRNSELVSSTDEVAGKDEITSSLEEELGTEARTGSEVVTELATELKPDTKVEDTFSDE